MSTIVRDMLNMAETQLKNAGCAAPGHDAEAIYMHIFAVDKLGLFKIWGQPISEKDADLYFAEIEKRAARIPLQHIIGSAEFMGIAFNVNEEVLIPRSDTEILVESVLGDVQAVATTGRNFRILDLCCGSGVIGLSLAANLPDCRVVLADISEAAVGLARANLAKIAGGVGGAGNAGGGDGGIGNGGRGNGKRGAGAATTALKKVALKQGDLLAPFKGRFRTEKFDIIATNPPYIPSAEIAALEPEVSEHEPKLALDGGPDGLAFYRRILREAPPHLRPGGKLYMEIGAPQASEIKQLAAETDFYESEIRIIKDLAGHDRVAILALKTSKPETSKKRKPEKAQKP